MFCENLLYDHNKNANKTVYTVSKYHAGHIDQETEDRLRNISFISDRTVGKHLGITAIVSII